MILLIDAGNTRVKWALVAPDAPLGSWQAHGAVMHADTAELQQAWQGHPIERVLIANVAGTTSIATNVTRQLRRKASSTPPASTSPIRIASRTLPVDSVTSVLWSYHFTNLTSGGRRGW